MEPEQNNANRTDTAPSKDSKKKDEKKEEDLVSFFHPIFNFSL